MGHRTDSKAASAISLFDVRWKKIKRHMITIGRRLPPNRFLAGQGNPLGIHTTTGSPAVGLGRRRLESLLSKPVGNLRCPPIPSHSTQFLSIKIAISQITSPDIKGSGSCDPFDGAVFQAPHASFVRRWNKGRELLRNPLRPFETWSFSFGNAVVCSESGPSLP